MFQQILQYWFSTTNVFTEEALPYFIDDFTISSDLTSRWFDKNDDLDREISLAFGSFHQELSALTRDELYKKLNSPEKKLAALIALDQFSRNIYRNSAAMYAQDMMAFNLALSCLNDGLLERAKHPVIGAFLLQAIRHREDPLLQKFSLKNHKYLLDKATAGTEPYRFAKIYYNKAQKAASIIQKFGRFPSRNCLIGRLSTFQEINHCQIAGFI